MKSSAVNLDDDLYFSLPALGGPDSYIVACRWALREIGVAAINADPSEIEMLEIGDVS